ncbi:hypothetical protein KAJ77_10270 [bacterium]|nr:hypothetical protein [bacterium]
MKTLIASIVMFMLVFAGGAAQTYADGWYAAATGCVPHDDAVQEDIYSTANGKVVFKEGKTGTVYLACNIDNYERKSDNPLYLYLNYQWAPGFQREPNNIVQAQLKRVIRSTGNIVNIADISSNIVAGKGNDVQRILRILPDDEQSLDLVNSYYYVIITLRRNTTEVNPTAIGVSVEPLIE